MHNLRSGVPFVFVGAGKEQKQKGPLITGYLKAKHDDQFSKVQTD